jgi:hypothetical protein
MPDRQVAWLSFSTLETDGVSLHDGVKEQTSHNNNCDDRSPIEIRSLRVRDVHTLLFASRNQGFTICVVVADALLKSAFPA